MEEKTDNKDVELPNNNTEDHVSQTWKGGITKSVSLKDIRDTHEICEDHTLLSSNITFLLIAPIVLLHSFYRFSRQCFGSVVIPIIL